MTTTISGRNLVPTNRPNGFDTIAVPDAGVQPQLRSSVPGASPGFDDRACSGTRSRTVFGHCAQHGIKGLLSPVTMDGLAERGVVGEILGQYHDSEGKDVEDPSLLPVGLSLADLRCSRRVIAVAAGADKHAAVKAALAGCTVNELVADDELAESLLRS